MGALTRSGLSCSDETSEDRILNLLEQYPPTLAICSDEARTSDGRLLLQAMGDVNPCVPRLALLQRSGPERVVHALSAGAVDVLCASFDREALLQPVCEILDRVRRWRENVVNSSKLKSAQRVFRPRGSVVLSPESTRHTCCQSWNVAPVS